MYQVAYCVHAEVDNEEFISHFIRSGEAIEFLKELVQSLTEAGCRVSCWIEKTIIEMTLEEVK